LFFDLPEMKHIQAMVNDSDEEEVKKKVGEFDSKYTDDEGGTLVASIGNVVGLTARDNFTPICTGAPRPPTDGVCTDDEIACGGRPILCGTDKFGTTCTEQCNIFSPRPNSCKLNRCVFACKIKPPNP